jgi:demethylmenaquinone methyltransferase / 2-methoxy-6-polyprenyl-1,4-benzoquinol methylase
MGLRGAWTSKGRQRGFAEELFTPLPERYDRLEVVLSLGQNARWRSEMLSHVCGGDPGLVLDVATGTAGVALEITGRTGARVVGVDLTDAMLRVGQRQVAGSNRKDRISLVQADARSLPFDDATFDALTFTYLLRYVPDPASTVRELARVVRPGGLIASLEFMRPPSPIWRGAWWVYTRAVLPAGGLVTGGKAWFDVGRFLGPSITDHYLRHPLSETVADWEKAGIEEVRARVMSLGGGLVMWGRRNDA